MVEEVAFPNRSGQAVIYCEHWRRCPDGLETFYLKCFFWVGHREGAGKVFILLSNKNVDRATNIKIET